MKNEMIEFELWKEQRAALKSFEEEAEMKIKDYYRCRRCPKCGHDINGIITKYLTTTTNWAIIIKCNCSTVEHLYSLDFLLSEDEIRDMNSIELKKALALFKDKVHSAIDLEVATLLANKYSDKPYKFKCPDEDILKAKKEKFKNQWNGVCGKGII